MKIKVERKDIYNAVHILLFELLVRKASRTKEPRISKSHFYPCKQCSRSVTFWYGSGSSDPYLWLTDPDHSLQIKSHKEVTKHKK
jgi:hypothetical protein